MKRSTLLQLLILSAGFSYGQQEALVSKNIFNGMLLNPAYSGTHSYYNTSMLYRTQWTGFEGAPKTVLIEADGPLHKEKMGVGMFLSHDRIGATEQTDVYASYSYKVKLGMNNLSFGIRAGLSHYRARLTNLTVWDGDDQVFAQDIHANLIPKFGYGMYYYGEKFYAGFAVPTLIAYDNNYSFSLNVEKSTYLRRHYYLHGGYVAHLNETIKLKPTILMKYVPSAPVQMELGANIIYKEYFSFGLACRTGDALIGMVEYRTGQRIRVAYSYDATISKFRKYSDGTHEILIGYEFGDKATVTRPSFF